jgi:hypothetical protein
MRKVWRNPRQVVVFGLPSEPEDPRRLERLVSLLSIGIERTLGRQCEEVPKSLDLQADVSPNTCHKERISKTIQ